jgi:arsenite methyltransferase
MTDTDNDAAIHGMVKQAYGQVAAGQLAGGGCGCGGAAPALDAVSSCCGSSTVTAAGQPLPQAELGLSCGNPGDFTQFQPGEIVLDLGSGAGRDAFIAAKAVCAEGRVIGVDMTPEMLKLARQNASVFADMYGLSNVEFHEGYIEALPVDDASVDVVISNCVINLSPNKAQVFRETARVLKPGGRIVVSDIVLNRELPPAARESVALYAACIAGALQRSDYLAAIEAAGLTGVEVLKDVTYVKTQAGPDPITGDVKDDLAGCAASITVRAWKR